MKEIILVALTLSDSYCNKREPLQEFEHENYEALTRLTTAYARILRKKMEERKDNVT